MIPKVIHKVIIVDDGKIPRCLKCYPYETGKQISKAETEILEWLTVLNINDVIINDRTILKGKELDIYIPSHSLAIEFNGLYWHSELNGKDKNYHLNKTIKCKEQDIQLIHIFEDEWLDKQDIIKNIIKIKLRLIEEKVYGRKCVIKELESNKYVKSCTNKNINFTKDFKIKVLELDRQ
jgi:hypothetical protein